MIEVRQVSRRFGSQLAVDNVSLTIERGTITVLVGTSGSGKSTLLRIINRLIEPGSEFRLHRHWFLSSAMD